MIDLKGLRVGCAMTGSYCTFKRVFEAWRALKATGADLYPIMSYNAAQIDTRFYSARDAMKAFESITGKEIWHTLPEVEPIGPKKLLDALVIAPCTGNTLAKLAGGIADTPVTLAAKSHLRNGRAVIIAVSSNDALGANAKNIGMLMASKDYFFVPFGQDDAAEKPRSLVAEFKMIPETLREALNNRQIEPVLR